MEHNASQPMARNAIVVSLRIFEFFVDINIDEVFVQTGARKRCLVPTIGVLEVCPGLVNARVYYMLFISGCAPGKIEPLSFPRQ